MVQTVVQLVYSRGGFACFCWGRAGVVVAMFALFLVGWPAMASDSSIYVHTAKIDETAKNANDAKSKGVLKAKIQGLQWVIQSIVPASRYGDVPTVSPDTIDGFIRAISFANERFSDERYVADLQINYDPEQVQSFLQNNGLAFAEIQSDPLLVIPIYERNGIAQLWENSNLWKSNWQNSVLDRRHGLVPLVVPDNSFSNWMVITASQAMTGERDKLNALIQKYNARGAVVAIARERLSDSGDTVLDVDLATYAPGLEGWQSTVFQETIADDALMENLQIATEMVAVAVQEEWKRRNLIHFDQQAKTLQATVFIKDLKDWADMQSRLGKTLNVRALSIVSVTVEQAVLTVGYVGSVDQLRTALHQWGLQLNYNGSVGGWVLVRTTVIANSDS